MVNKEIYSRDEVIKMLQEMQKESIKTQGFIVGYLTQLWVIRDLIGKRIHEIGRDEISYTVK